MTSGQKIRVEHEDRIAIIHLNRPESLNALDHDLMQELISAFESLDQEKKVGAFVVTGGEKVFSAGADLKEMASKGPIEMMEENHLALWDRIRRVSKPIIAAVSGYCLGGGLELAMTCDIIVAGETARFGQPEINVGVMPGAGGTQRLTRTVGKYRAMEMVLTGNHVDAREAYRMGLVNRVVPPQLVLDEAKKLAKIISDKSPVATRLAKQAVLKSFSTSLEDGLDFERRNFYLLFATDDAKEGIRAFLEKRQASFRGK